jgi:DNA-directed RNA polymerase subunit RPC12/RpoP
MSVITTCPSCDRKLKTPADAEGRKIRCPSCSATLLVTEEGVELPRTRGSSSGGRRSRDDEDEAPVRRPRRRDDPDEDDRDEDDRPSRRRRRRQGGGIPVWAWWTGGGVGAAILVGVVLFLLLRGGGSLANYDKVKNGMTEKEVVALLGKPTQDSDEAFAMMGAKPPKIAGMPDIKALIWQDGEMIVQVSFINGKVQSKVKLDAKSFGGFKPGGGRPGFGF